ncbi:GTP-binding and nucleic acid-binding protein YchF, partial [Mycoplasma putrefaciens]
MGLKVAIVGLPNVGKSTLFNAITNSKVEAANYPFATIEPNIGIVEVPDQRLDRLQEIFNSKKKISTTIEFVDVAGLIAGASKGEGLGNAFLANIRETDAICQVVRCFDSKDITHVEGSVDPIRDIEIINLELILADEATLKKRLEKINPKVKSGEKTFVAEASLINELLETLNKGQLLNTLTLEPEETKILKSYQLLTSKPIIYVCNVNDDSLFEDNEYVLKVKEFAKNNNNQVVKICAKIEEDLSEANREEKIEFLKELGVTQSGLDQLIQVSYQTLGLQTFFTAGVQEARSW